MITFLQIYFVVFKRRLEWPSPRVFLYLTTVSFDHVEEKTRCIIVVLAGADITSERFNLERVE